MTSQPRLHGLGYESPTEQTVASALVTNQLICRLNELERISSRQDGAPRQPVTVDELMSSSKTSGGKRTVGIKDRIACFQWTWFTSTMATGGIANVLASSMSHRSRTPSKRRPSSVQISSSTFPGPMA